MQIVHLTTVDQSGAGHAAMRIVRALKEAGIDTYLLCLFRRIEDNPDTIRYIPPRTSFWIRVLRRIHFKFSSDVLRKKAFAPYKMNDGVHFLHSDCLVEKSEMIKRADIIHLHWIDQFVDLSSLFKDTYQPIVWTLHDMGAFTAVCNYYYHYCVRYQAQCGKCPALDSQKENDITRQLWKEKHDLYQNNLQRLYIVTCSSWLADCAKKSGLLHDANIRVIPNCVDTAIYKPQPHTLPRKGIRVMLGAVNAKDPNKGYLRLCRIVDRLANSGLENVEVIVVGHQSDQLSFAPNVVVKSHGFVGNDKDLATLYNSVDILLYGSYRDNLPNMIMEAMACGIPVVAFPIGGIPDMVEHKVTGYLAQSEDDYLAGISYCMEHWNELSGNARTKVERDYSPNIIADMYNQLYKEIFV